MGIPHENVFRQHRVNIVIPKKGGANDGHFFRSTLWHLEGHQPAVTKPIGRIVALHANDIAMLTFQALLDALLNFYVIHDASRRHSSR